MWSAFSRAIEEVRAVGLDDIALVDACLLDVCRGVVVGAGFLVCHVPRRPGDGVRACWRGPAEGPVQPVGVKLAGA